MEENLLSESTKADKTNSASSARKGSETDTLEYYLTLDCPTKDAITFVKSGGVLSTTKVVRIGDRVPTREEQQQLATVINPTYPNYHCCNGICLTIPEDPYGFYLPFTDFWGNPISFIGRYGTDPRQMYYVSLPPDVNIDSKIVVLIHGGGWITGPDPNVINGWSPAFAPLPASNQQQNNIVKKLLIQGYAVVSLLYRLASYGDNNTDILASPVTVQDQINDVETAITHIHTNFPTCLWQKPLNANNIQIIGESAGANLSLMYAYTRADISYVKSVISVAGPTNMNQFADFLNTKTLINSSLQQSCNISTGNNFVYYNFNNSNFTHFPFYGIYDPTADATNFTTTGYTNPTTFSCKIADIQTITGFLFNNPNLPIYSTISPSANNTNKRRTDLYKQVQSVVRQVITNPISNSTFTNISPCFNLSAVRIVPTFIIHGTSDELVPYTRATNNMEASLTNFGGLIGKYNSTSKNILGQNIAPLLPSTIPLSSYYPTATNKHIIKTYTNAGHGVQYNANVQPDVLTWLTGH